LPDRVPLAAVAGLSTVADGGRFVPVGIGDTDLVPVGLRLHAGDHVLIAGPARSGRTTALATIASLAAAGDPELDVVAVVRGESVLAEVAGTACRTVDELVEIIESRQNPQLILIDDAERVDHPALAALFDGHDEALHVIAAGRADALRGLYQHWTRGLRRCRLGISLRPQADLDGELWQTQFPRRGPDFSQPGRGYLVSGGDLEIVQVAAS
jgi:S-DNA-T family DNA segregation ATPase FtsK/SpoIIIE